MPRFVVLEHDHPTLHWDFMLEAGPVLRTWRLSAVPELGRSIAAAALPDHRLMYLDYEGPVSGNRGRVSRWDSGVYSWSENREDRVSVMLEGNRFKGMVTLTQEEGGAWTLTCPPEKNQPRS